MENLSESVKQHDNYQFEAKFTYPLDKAKEINSYYVDTYIFIPNNIGINRYTYSREDYFNDMQRLIRFKTPAMLLRVINTEIENSPIAKLRSAMENLSRAGSKDAVSVLDYEERMKMFCSVIKSALRDEERYLEKSKNDPDFRVLVENYLANSIDIVRKFRELKILVQTPNISPKQFRLYQLVDEFISISVNKYRYKLVLALSKTHLTWVPEVKPRIIEAIRDEIKHRAVNMYPTVPKLDSDNEEIIYRENALRKGMASVLLLKTEMQRDGVLLEHLVFGFAAGIAMAFATSVTFYSQNRFQDFSLSLFVLVVIAYMFKDRIKEISRTYFYSKMKRFIADYRTDITSILGKKVGTCKDSFSFIPESSLPPQIVQLRNKDYTSELENGYAGEQIIFSRKHISLYSKACENIFSDFDVDGIVDIIKFNICGFLEKMNNPETDVFLPAEDRDEIITTKGKRVYHVNLIIKYGIQDGEDHYKRFRLVLSRDGIRRIEQVPSPNQDDDDDEAGID